MTLVRRLAACVTLLLAGTGCAFGAMPITLPTAPLEASVRGGAGRQIVVVAPFSDAREQERCGMKKNGYNMDTADAVCESAPGAWFARRLAQELAVAGFQVVAPGERAKPSALRVEGSVLQLFIEPVIGFWSGSVEADLSVRLRATSQTGLVAERTFFVKGWKGGIQVVTAQPYHTATHRATQALLEETVRAIVELMDRYPELGSLRLHWPAREARS